jgi:hypothetical protein
VRPDAHVVAERDIGIDAADADAIVDGAMLADRDPPVPVWTTANGLIREPLPILIWGESCTIAIWLTPQPNLAE